MCNVHLERLVTHPCVIVPANGDDASVAVAAGHPPIPQRERGWHRHHAETADSPAVRWRAFPPTSGRVP